MTFKERLSKNFTETKQFFMFWKWSAEDIRMFIKLFSVLVLGVYLGMYIQCWKQESVLGGGNLAEAVFNPRCISLQCTKYPDTCNLGNIIKEINESKYYEDIQPIIKGDTVWDNKSLLIVS